MGVCKSQQKNKNTILHVYNSKIGGLEERLFETRVDPGKMNESNLPTIEVMSFKNMNNDDDYNVLDVVIIVNLILGT